MRARARARAHSFVFRWDRPHFGPQIVFSQIAITLSYGDVLGVVRAQGCANVQFLQLRAGQHSLRQSARETNTDNNKKSGAPTHAPFSDFEPTHALWTALGTAASGPRRHCGTGCAHAGAHVCAARRTARAVMDSSVTLLPPRPTSNLGVACRIRQVFKHKHLPFQTRRTRAHSRPRTHMHRAYFDLF